MRNGLGLAVIVTTALAAGPVQAGMEVPGLTADVKTYSCQELGALDEARHLYFSGYVDGQRNAVRFDWKTKAEAADRVLEHCRANPADSVLQTFLRFTP